MQLTIERMIYGGDGLGRLPIESGRGGRGKAVFIPFVLPGETVQARIEEEKSGFARGALQSIEIASPKRIDAACPYFFRCGGCHYQHIDYNEQVHLKVEVLHETLKRTGGIDLGTAIETHTADPWGYRNRTRLHVRHQPGFALGYYRFRSHRLLPVDVCPISAPAIGGALEAIARVGASGGMPPSVREIEAFTDPAGKTVLLSFYCAATSFDETCEKISADELKTVAESIEKFVPNLAGIAAFDETSGDSRPLAATGALSLTYPTAFGSFRMSAGSFFQTNRFLLEKMVHLATAGKRGKSALDLYAGVGLFSATLANQFEEVWSVESERASFADLEYNLRDQPHAHPTHARVEEFLKAPAPADYAVVDPPRNGLGPDVCQALDHLRISRLCYVSCDPATLARDLKQLVAGGYRIEEAHMVDMFPQTFHIESVFQLVR